MSSGTFSASSTYQPGKGISFARDIGSRVLNAAQAAKDEKKYQEKFEKEGGEVPESAKKGLFAKALKQEFISNPVNNLKKNLNKKISGAANVAGFFGSKGRRLEDKILGKKFSIRNKGFDRSGYVKKSDDEDNTGGGGSGSGGPTTATLGSLVLDIQAIASAVSSMQGLINSQMTITSKIADSLGEIKTVLAEQVTLQQQRIDDEERVAAEASLESSQQVSGTSKATSTVTEGGGLFEMFGQLQGLLGMLGNLPGLFKGMFTTLIDKLPFAKGIASKLFGSVAKEGAEELVEEGSKGILSKIFGKIFKPIPIIGGLIDFAINLALGEPIGRAAAKAVGSTVGAGLGTLIPIPGIGTIAGGILGDWVGGTLYDWITGMISGPEKMASGGVMIGEAGKEAVVDLNSSQGRQQFGGAGTKDIDAAGETFYSSIAGTTLAVTKQFVEGLGPIGSSVAPIIQDDISKLGKVFELPATAIKMSVGGAGLNPVPGAEKKGEKFLEKLVSGSLEKIGKKKDKNKKISGGGGDGGNGNDPSPAPPPNPNKPTGGGKNDFSFGDSISSGLAGRQGGNQQTVMDDKGISKVGASPADVLGQLQAFDKTKLKGKTVRLSTGITNGPSDLKSVEEQIKYLVSVGAKVQVVGVTNTPPKTGPYKHLEKPLAGMNDKLSALVSKYSDKGVTFLGGFTPGADGIHPADYSALNTSYNVDVLPGGKVGAEQGGKINLVNSSGTPVKDWKTLEVHHPSEGPQEKYRPSPNAGKQNLAKDIVLLDGNSTDVGVPSPMDGTISPLSFTSAMGDYGPHFVEVVSGSQKVWIGHMKSSKVKVGDKVKAGQILGVQGNMGQSTGPHVHIQGDEGVIKSWVSGMLSGNYTSVTSPDDNTNTEDVEESDVDPFESIDKGLADMLAGAFTVGAKDTADFTARETEGKAAAERLKAALSSTGPTTTPTGTTPSTQAQPNVNITAMQQQPAVVPVSQSSIPTSLSRPTTPSNTPQSLSPVRPV